MLHGVPANQPATPSALHFLRVNYLLLPLGLIISCP